MLQVLLTAYESFLFFFLFLSFLSFSLSFSLLYFSFFSFFLSLLQCRTYTSKTYHTNVRGSAACRWGGVERQQIVDQNITNTQGRVSLNVWSAQCKGHRQRQLRTEHRQRTHTQSQDRNINLWSHRESNPGRRATLLTTPRRRSQCVYWCNRLLCSPLRMSVRVEELWYQTEKQL